MTTTAKTPPTAQELLDLEPGRFVLFVIVEGAPGLPEPFRHRIGGYRTREAAERAAARDREAMFKPSPVDVIIGRTSAHKRTYRIFEATGWKVVS